MSIHTNNEHELLYIISPDFHDESKLISLFSSHPEIKFVSLAGIDLRGNDTDEKIPIQLFEKDIKSFLSGGVQTDGSSVVLPGIATLNNGKLDLIADTDVNWYIDYNYEHIDEVTEMPVGTLRIPAFLLHNEKMVDSRSILKRACNYFESEIKRIFKENKMVCSMFGVEADDIAGVEATVATELEFWVKTPGDQAEIEELSVSQVLQEQYWKRTKGNVRTALEKCILMLDKYGLKPEMGHKEVGGVKAKLSEDGNLAHIMEQLEVDWKFSTALQASDNELLARIVIKETFRRYGLEVTFMAKPIHGVAGSGEHTHINAMLKLKNGKVKNLFAPEDMKKDFLSVLGWGAVMGILKNYEVINPFITSSNDALNRLKPGFEAPICIVASVGHNVITPSRNRTVLLGLVRDMENPLSLRFEVRSPNPHTNTFIAAAAMMQGMLDGVKYAAYSGKTSSLLEKEFSKKAGEASDYLEKDRAYRSEEDVFEHYTENERNIIFGAPPRTVWENISSLSSQRDKTSILESGNVFDKDLIESYVTAVRIQWTMELCERILCENADYVRRCVKLHIDDDAYDNELWVEINKIRHYMLKCSHDQKSLFSRIREYIEKENFDKVSDLQIEMADKMSELERLYGNYKRNILAE